MAWNEPGDPKNKDPWGNKGGQEPPDLDEIARKAKEKLNNLFGSGGKKSRYRSQNGSSGSDGNNSTTEFNKSFLIIPFVVAILVWVAAGFYTVEQGKQAVVLQFGAYNETTDAGLHWHMPIIQKYYIVDVSAIQSLDLGDRSSEAMMLTKDENIVDIKMTVQFRIQEPEKFLFNVRDPGLVLKQVTESAIREIIGLNMMDYVITGGRTQIAQKVQTLSQEILDRYQSGLIVTKFVLRDAQPPEQVQHAFDDAVKAREDKVKFVNQAVTYQNEILPLAKGKAAKLIAEAEAYSAKVISEAEGESNRFDSILQQYQTAKDVTRERLYLDAMQSIMANTNKVMVDNKSGNSLMYLPIDKLIQRNQSKEVKSFPLNKFDFKTSDNKSSNFNAGRDNGMDSRSRNSRERK